SAGHDIQVPVVDGDAIFAALATPPGEKTRVTISEANHVYKRETRDPRTLPPPEIAASYAEADRPLADGLVAALVAFVTPGEPASHGPRLPGTRESRTCTAAEAQPFLDRMNGKTLRTEVRDRVHVITLTRAREYNTITPELRDELAQAIDEGDADR